MQTHVYTIWITAAVDSIQSRCTNVHRHVYVLGLFSIHRHSRVYTDTDGMAARDDEPLCVDDFEPYLERGVEDTFWQFYTSGADGEHTLRDNTAAYKRYRLRPRCLRDVSQRDTSCRVLGHRLEFPVGVSPTACHGLAHFNGEIETVKGVASAGTAMVLSMWANKRLEDVAAAAKVDTPLFQQVNFMSDKTRLEWVIRRAEAAGYKALFATVDQPFVGNRIRHYKWPLNLPPYIEFPQVMKPGETFSREISHALFDPSATWNDVTCLTRMTSLPIVVKGVLTAESAKEAVRRGVAGILVSNHGGRQLDGVPATIDALAEVVEAVRGSDVEVYLDGGIRTGTDVLKALVMGARAVFIGRPAIWGLAYDGGRGVRKVLEILKEEFSTAMALSGCSSVADITPDLITISPWLSKL